MTIHFDRADRLKKLPPYLFSEIDRKKKAAIAEGRDIIDLGIGDPDIPTPGFIIDALHEGARIKEYHRYPLDEGHPQFRTTMAKWFAKRFGVEIDPRKELIAVIGSKEAIGHFPLSILNPGDVSLIPDPCYPPYRSGTIFAGGEPFHMPLTDKNGFLPDYNAVPEDILRRAKVIYVNYPNNPTGAVTTKEWYDGLVAFAKRNSLAVVSDLAYSEVAFGYTPPSILQSDTAKEVSIEFHSLSKTFNMTGWRVGFAVGNAELISGLAAIKSNLDSGVFTAIQHAAIRAFENWDEVTSANNVLYQKRRDVLCAGLDKAGLKYLVPKATFYIWINVPAGYTSAEFATKMLEEANIVMTPGNGFGSAGEGYIRAAITVDEERIAEAANRIVKLKI